MSSIVDPYWRSGQLQGACLCGACTLTIDGNYVAAIGVCHCSMCHRWSGGILGLFEAEATAVTVHGPIGRHMTSPFAERAFCTVCGSSLWMRDVVDENPSYEFVAGAFPAAKAFPLISEIYTDTAPAFSTLSGTHKRATRAEYESKHRFVEGDLP
jgi:hypothetical protein